MDGGRVDAVAVRVIKNVDVSSEPISLVPLQSVSALCQRWSERSSPR